MSKKQFIFSLLALSSTCFSSVAFADASVPVVQGEVKKNFELRMKQTRVFVAQVTGDNKETLQLLDRLQTNLTKAYTDEHALDDAEIDLILAAIEFATDKHKDQVRKNKDKSPYITHPLLVTLYLVEDGKVRDSQLITAALLHDTVSDSVATSDEIQKKFGKQVALYVGEMTEDKGAPRAERKRRQVIAAAHQSLGAAQIRMADQLCNLKELRTTPPEDWNRTRIDEYYHWSQSVLDRLPTANPELKKATSHVIEEYWQDQEKSAKR